MNVIFSNKGEFCSGEYFLIVSKESIKSAKKSCVQQGGVGS